MATEEEKLAALRKQMAQLEAQAASTQESLTEALTIPGTKKLAEEIAAVTEAIKDQLNTRGQLKAEIESLRVEEQRLKDANDPNNEVKCYHTTKQNARCKFDHLPGLIFCTKHAVSNRETKPLFRTWNASWKRRSATRRRLRFSRI